MKDERLTALENVIASFTLQHPNIKIMPEYVEGYGNLHKRVAAAIETQRLPDLALAYEPMVSLYARKGVVVELDRYVHDRNYGLSRADLDDLFPAFLEANSYRDYQNRLLSFPFGKSILVMYYNKDLLERAGIRAAPTTWRDFEEACRAVRARTESKGYIIDVDASTIVGWIYSRGGAVLAPDQTTPYLDSREGIDSLALIQRLLDDGSGYLISSRFEDQEDFGNGRVAFVLTSSSGLYYAQQAMATGAKADWGVAIIPQGGTNPTNPATVLYGPNIVIFRSTPTRQLAAWLFIRHFASQQVTARWAVSSQYLPLRQSVIHDQAMQAYFRSFPQYAQVLEVLQFAQPEPQVPAWQIARGLLEDALVGVATNSAPPAKALADAQLKAAEASHNDI